MAPKVQTFGVRLDFFLIKYQFCQISGCLSKSLQFYQTAIITAAFHQDGVGAGFDNFAFVEHDDHIGVLDGTQAVRDDDCRALAEQKLEGFLHQLF